jgi:hypothetical protein
MSNYKKDKTKKQHFVPQFYLEKFANISNSKKKYKIWIFDKKTNKNYSSDVEDFPIEIGEDIYKIFDTDLQNHENKVAPFYLQFKENIDNKRKKQTKQPEIITKKDKRCLSNILAIQALRTPKLRNSLKEVPEKAEKENLIQDILKNEINNNIIKDLKTLFPELQSRQIEDIKYFLTDITNIIIQESYTDKLIPISHYKFFKKYLHDLSQIFFQRQWSIGVNQTDIPFYTSDHPVVKIPYSETGYASENTEILFPINSKIILILDKKQYPRSYKGDCKLVNLAEDEVKNYNKAQIYSSNRFIYCQESKFELVQEICEKQPDVCSGVKNRVKFI